MKKETNLTELQEVFLNDLRKNKVLVVSMAKLCKMYAEITYNAAIKREIEELVGQGLVSRKIKRTTTNGRMITSVIYQLK